jgi:hypothetical protein
MKRWLTISVLIALAIVPADQLYAAFASFQTNGKAIPPPPPGGPGLTLGIYGDTTAAGWTHIGPSDGTLASGFVTNIIYVSDSLGDDNRDGSTPTFVDDNATIQFVITSGSATVPAVYKDLVSGQSCTVAVTIASKTFMQCGSRTGTPSASGTLTKQSGTGDAALIYSSFTLGIHGPVKTLTKGAGGTGPGPYNPDNNGSSSVFNGDGTGLGTIGNWRTAGGVGSAFAMRDGHPDWLLLRMGDTFTGQTIERGFSVAGGSDNFGLGGFSEVEPLVVSAYDEAIPATSPNLPSGARARPIITVPSTTVAYAGMQGAGNVHLYQSRPAAFQIQGPHNYAVIMGIDFYSPQRNPAAMEYVGSANVVDTTAIDIPGGLTGFLIEDVHSRWLTAGFSINDAGHNFDLNIRRSQADHCYGNRALGTNADFVDSAGGAIASGFNFEENVLDLCGYVDAALTMGDSRSRNAYLQWNAIFGNRRGNTSTRSGSENFQFRAGGVIDNNFTYNGSYGFDTGHNEGDPALTSATSVTSNVIMTTDNPLGPGLGVALNFLNSNGVTVSNNLIAHADPTSGAFGYFAITDAVVGDVEGSVDGGVAVSNAGSGGATGLYGCVGGANFTGGHGTSLSTYTMRVSAGSITSMTFAEPSSGQTFLVGDVLTPVSGYPSINTAGTTLTNTGTGGTPGSYGFAFAPTCAVNPVNTGFGPGTGVALTGGSGTGALATFAYSAFSSITRANVGGTYFATGTLSTPLVVFTNDKITVSGVTPSAYNGDWVISSGGVNDTSTPTSSITWSLGTGVDPGAETVPGKATSYVIISTGKNYAVNDILTASPGGLSGLQIKVNSLAGLTGWQLTVTTLQSSGVHGLTFTGNTIFNWPDDGPPTVVGADAGGTHDSPGGIPGSGVANTWTGNTVCTTTSAQFTGVITGTNTLTTSALAQGTIVIGQNLAGPNVAANTTITGGGPTTWTVSPNQTAPSETMYSYTCTPTTVFTAPWKTVATYAASLGLTASIDGYMNAASANARWNYNPALTANNGINPYIRHGFGMTP